jgi:rhamnosyltransferase
MKISPKIEKPKVAVLLATHNPQEFVIDQIDSIREQQGVDTKIYWGDYASSENSKQLVRESLEGLDFVEFAILEKGHTANFMFLLSKSSEMYVAFCDQDDVWLPHKLINQVELLKKYTGPSLTHSNSEILVGKKRKSKRVSCLNHDFSSLAFANCCQGCTIMINSEARELVLKSLPDKLVWHDWWIALVISLTGHISFGESTDVLYRIHGSNTIGLPNLGIRFRNYLTRPSGQISYQVEEAILRFAQKSDLTQKELSHLKKLCSRYFWIRFSANLIDTRRRKFAVQDLVRRVAWTVKRP